MTDPQSIYRQREKELAAANLACIQASTAEAVDSAECEFERVADLYLDAREAWYKVAPLAEKVAMLSYDKLAQPLDISDDVRALGFDPAQFGVCETDVKFAS